MANTMKSTSSGNHTSLSEPLDKFDMSAICSAPPQPKLWKQIVFLYFLTGFGIIFPILLVVRILSENHDFTISIGRAIIVFGVPVCLVIALIKLWFSVDIIKKQLGVKLLDENTTNPKELWLIDLITALSKKANLPNTPLIGIYESEELNAFAAGPTRSRAMVAFSSGILEQMGQPQLAAVAAHEVGHIASGDMLSMQIVQGVIWGSALIGNLVGNCIKMFFEELGNNKKDTGKGKKLDQQMKELKYDFFGKNIVGTCITSFGNIVSLAFSRYREFKADKFSATMTSPLLMSSALQYLLNDQKAGTTTQANSPYAALMISAPEGWADWLSTHPSLERRIEHLKSFQADALRVPEEAVLEQKK